MSASAGTTDRPFVFRLSRLAWIIVLLVVFCVVPVAFTDSFQHDKQGAPSGPPSTVGWQTLVLLVPLLAGLFVARTATLVGESGIRVRAVFGSRFFAWDAIRGLKVQDRSIYLVVTDGAVRLPCVHLNELGALSRAAGGRLPEISDPRPTWSGPKRRRR